MVINEWPALTVAVQNQWGGADSAEKRDWIPTTILDLYEEQPEVDVEDIEDRLMQIMEDEFETTVDDDSAYECALKIDAVFKQCLEGNFAAVDDMYQRYLARQQQPAAAAAVVVQSVGDDVGSDEDVDEDDEMAEAAPAPAPAPAPRPERIVDDDGFELVQKPRRKR
ncbi:Pre-rRNA-processing protein TSR2-domain-containing protein [Dipodascopsis tothii]|uniref:Pre-rRNA-processing protein TSR2-domain-containing protein n=1 Tax=Dipodascopsis tothii TaxID=44089 RepID=UPI0034CF0ED8